MVYSGLKIASKTFDFVCEEIHILVSYRRALQNQPEEIGQVTQRRVGDHHAARFHHPLFHFWRHLISIETNWQLSAGL